MSPLEDPKPGAGAPGPPDWLALAGATATVALHFLFQAEGPNPIFIIGACLFWATFVAARARRDRGVFRAWGFRADNLLEAAQIPAALFAVAGAGFAVYGHLHGTLSFPPHLPLLFLVYPVWGVVQQFLVLGVAVGNLERLPALGRRKALLVVLGAALFAPVHAYELRLVAATFFLEAVLAALYLKQRNLWPLGVVHGWLGALFYLWVLGRDLWAENFG